MRPILVLPIALLAISDLVAAEARPTPDAVVELGRALFEDGRLSVDGSVSCATCHDPARSFADGAPESKGVLGVTVGRNTPTLWGLDTVRAFPIEGRTSHLLPGMTAASLAERCVAPIENPLEMALPVEAAVRRLNDDRKTRERFARAFDVPHGGATRENLGEALAAFVRTLQAPPSPYRAHLAGDASALTAEEKAGLSIFETRGRCASCHSGPGLTDGRMHVVTSADERSDPRRSRKARHRQKKDSRAAVRAAKKKDVDPQLRNQISRSVQQGGYGGNGGNVHQRPQTQTLTLWDVTRTAPYFRDGSEPDLEDAVRDHLRRLRESEDEVRASAEARRAVAAALREAENPAVQATLGRLHLPDALAPPEVEGRPRTPALLTDAEVDYLMQFLRTLSPRAPDLASNG